jgi:hypothetical protein
MCICIYGGTFFDSIYMVVVLLLVFVTLLSCNQTCFSHIKIPILKNKKKKKKSSTNEYKKIFNKLYNFNILIKDNIFHFLF